MENVLSKKRFLTQDQLHYKNGAISALVQHPRQKMSSTRLLLLTSAVKFTSHYETQSVSSPKWSQNSWQATTGSTTDKFSIPTFPLFRKISFAHRWRWPIVISIAARQIAFPKASARVGEPVSANLRKHLS